MFIHSLFPRRDVSLHEHRLCFDVERFIPTEADAKAEKAKKDVQQQTRDKVVKLKQEVEKGNKMETLSKDQLDRERDALTAFVNGLRDLQANDPAFIKQLQDEANNPNLVEQLEKTILPNLAVGETRSELTGILDRISPGMIGQFLQQNQNGESADKNLYEGVGKVLNSETMKPIMEQAQKIGLRFDSIQNFIFAMMRNIVANKLAMFGASLGLEDNEFIDKAREVGKDMHYRMALEAYRRYMTRAAGGNVYRLGQLGETANAEREMSITTEIKTRWGDLYDKWSDRARGFIRDNNRRARPGRQPKILDAWTEKAGKAYEATVLNVTQEADKKAAELLSKEEKEANEKLNKNAVRINTTLDFGAFGGNIEITPDRSVIIQHNGQPVAIRRNGAVFQMRIGENGPWLRLQNRQADNTDVDITHLRLWAPRIGDETSGIRVTIDDDNAKYRNLGYLVQNATLATSTRRIVYDFNAETTHMLP